MKLKHFEPKWDTENGKIKFFLNLKDFNSKYFGDYGFSLCITLDDNADIKEYRVCQHSYIFVSAKNSSHSDKVLNDSIAEKFIKHSALCGFTSNDDEMLTSIHKRDLLKFIEEFIFEDKSNEFFINEVKQDIYDSIKYVEKSKPVWRAKKSTDEQIRRLYEEIDYNKNPIQTNFFVLK